MKVPSIIIIAHHNAVKNVKRTQVLNLGDTTANSKRLVKFYFVPSHSGTGHTSHGLGLIILCILNPVNWSHKLLETQLAISKKLATF